MAAGSSRFQLLALVIVGGIFLLSNKRRDAREARARGHRPPPGGASLPGTDAAAYARLADPNGDLAKLEAHMLELARRDVGKKGGGGVDVAVAASDAARVTTGPGAAASRPPASLQDALKQVGGTWGRSWGGGARARPGGGPRPTLVCRPTPRRRRAMPPSC